MSHSVSSIIIIYAFSFCLFIWTMTEQSYMYLQYCRPNWTALCIPKLSIQIMFTFNECDANKFIIILGLSGKYKWIWCIIFAFWIQLYTHDIHSVLLFRWMNIFASDNTIAPMAIPFILTSYCQLSNERSACH